MSRECHKVSRECRGVVAGCRGVSRRRHGGVTEMSQDVAGMSQDVAGVTTPLQTYPLALSPAVSASPIVRGSYPARPGRPSLYDVRVRQR